MISTAVMPAANSALHSVQTASRSWAVIGVVGHRTTSSWVALSDSSSSAVGRPSQSPGTWHTAAPNRLPRRRQSIVEWRSTGAVSKSRRSGGPAGSAELRQLRSALISPPMMMNRWIILGCRRAAAAPTPLLVTAVGAGRRPNRERHGPREVGRRPRPVPPLARPAPEPRRPDDSRTISPNTRRTIPYGQPSGLPFRVRRRTAWAGEPGGSADPAKWDVLPCATWTS